MMGPYDPAEPLARIIDQLKKGQEFARAGGQTIENVMMVSKCITLLAQIFGSGTYNTTSSKHGQASISSSTESTDNREEW